MNVTQPGLAKKLGTLSATSIAHYEGGKRRPDSAAAIILCRAAEAAGRNDLADIFAAIVPGVEEGLLIPRWRLPVAPEPVAEEPVAADGPAPHPSPWKNQKPYTPYVRAEPKPGPIEVKVQVTKAPEPKPVYVKVLHTKAPEDPSKKSAPRSRPALRLRRRKQDPPAPF
jgi:hypothetical protein